MSAEPIHEPVIERPRLTLVPAWRPRKPCTRCGADKGPGTARRLCDSCRARPPCKACGGPKPAGKGRRLCDECAELGRWRKAQRAKAHVVALRKPCAGCGGRKGPGPGRYCPACREAKGTVGCRRCGAPKRRGDGSMLCKACGPPLRAKRPCPDCGSAKSPGKGKRYCDKCMRRRAKTVRKRAAESSRIRCRLAAERESGRHIDTIPRHKTKLNGYTDHPTGKADRNFDAAPLVAWLREAEKLFADRGELALKLEVGDRRIFDLVHGNQTTVTLGVADRCLWNLDRVLRVPGFGDVASLGDLWPVLA